MRRWGCYSRRHAEVDLAGDRDGIRHLARLIRGGEEDEFALDDPPADWMTGDTHPLDAVRVAAAEGKRISFQREDQTFVVSGERAELVRIVAGSIDRLAELPYRTNSVPTHVHLDPTSDPERRFYTSESGSLIVRLWDESER